MVFIKNLMNTPSPGRPYRYDHPSLHLRAPGPATFSCLQMLQYSHTVAVRVGGLPAHVAANLYSGLVSQIASTDIGPMVLCDCAACAHVP